MERQSIDRVVAIGVVLALEPAQGNVIHGPRIAESLGRRLRWCLRLRHPGAYGPRTSFDGMPLGVRPSVH